MTICHSSSTPTHRLFTNCSSSRTSVRLFNCLLNVAGLYMPTGEVFPTDVRGFFHGVSAASGKVGALIAAVAFQHVSSRTTFYLSASFGLAGCLVSGPVPTVPSFICDAKPTGTVLCRGASGICCD